MSDDRVVRQQADEVLSVVKRGPYGLPIVSARTDEHDQRVTVSCTHQSGILGNHPHLWATRAGGSYYQGEERQSGHTGFHRLRLPQSGLVAARRARARRGPGSGGAALRRQRLHGGVPGGAALPRREGAADLRGHGRDPGVADRAQPARELSGAAALLPLDVTLPRQQLGRQHGPARRAAHGVVGKRDEAPVEERVRTKAADRDGLAVARVAI